MVIPVFGIVFEDKQRLSRPLKDRFTAEVRFLKKYHALDYYLKSNPAVLNNQQNAEQKKEKIYNYRELINEYRRIFNETGT
jgi:hypothetical protein